jgi:hypothetical protein
MLKIGIFGDSFADENTFSNEYAIAWPTMLRNTTKHSVTNYGIGGSSLYYSYQMFMKNYDKFDRIIFIVTNIGRLWIRNFQDLDARLCHIPGISVIPERRKIFSSVEYKNFWDACESYYLHIQDFEKESNLHHLMIDKIKSLRPDTLLIPIDYPALENYSGISLYEISELDYKHFNIGQDEKIKYNDIRPCHFNKFNTDVFYKKILQWLDTNEFILNLNEFKAATGQPIEEIFVEQYSSRWEKLFTRRK